VLSPIQRGLLAVIGFIFVMAFQIHELRTASFRIELFDRPVLRVDPTDTPTITHALASRVQAPIPTMAPEDWPAPPIRTDWQPMPVLTTCDE
jgi:hypothetical protein